MCISPGELRPRSSSSGQVMKNVGKSHGMCLTPSDQDRLRIFMHEFVVRALIPWAERQMKMLNEQVNSFDSFIQSFLF